MSSPRQWQRLFLGVFLLLCFTFVSIASAQDAGPINLNENKVGNLSQPGSLIEFTLTSTSAQTVVVQVLSITQGLLPAFEVIDPSGIIIGGNAGGQDIVQGSASLPAPGVYRVRVHSTVNRAGDFLISIQGGAPAAPPTSLVLGQPINTQVDSQTSVRSYSFLGSPTEALVLRLTSSQPDAGPVVTLKDGSTNQVLAITSARLSGVNYRIPATVTTVQYVLDVTFSGAASALPYVVCLETASGAIPCPAIPGSGSSGGVTAPTAIPTQQVVVPTFQPVEIPPTGACQVASLQGQTINVRQGPGLDFAIVGRLQPNATALVFGRLADNSWYQVNVSGVLGWVSSTVVRIGGLCNGVPVLQPPTPVATLTLPPGFPTLTFTPTPSATFAFTATPSPAPVATLNYSLSPTFGSTSLTAGFVPDPFTTGVTSGGIVNVSYLGGACRGFAAVAPDFSVNYTSGGASLLRFYFVGSGDTTMIINGPSGSFFCADDSFGGLNPTIDFNSPGSGRYDIWIGSFSQGNNTSGTLSVTELSGNHP